MRAFVTGADGFAGQWLLRALLEAGDEVAGASRAERLPLSTLPAADAQRVRWYRVDLRDGAEIAAALADWKPDALFHLAAQAFVPESVQDPLETFEINVLGTARVLEACRANAPESAVLIVASADAYGQVDAAQLPVREDTPLRPLNPYAASKAAAETIALQYARSGWLKTIVMRPFNHTGPGQSSAFAVPSFAKQIAGMKVSAAPRVLKAGDLSAKRDLTDVRDVAYAYRLAALRGKAGAVYNVCSGRAVSMQEVVDGLIGIAGFEVRIERDEARMRGADIPVIYGDAKALSDDTGWRCRIPLRQTLEDVFEYFCSRPEIE